MLLVAEPVLGQEEQTALSEVIESGWITMGPRVEEFEEAFAALHGVKNCVAVSSCTAALHLALAALGLGPGDEVLVPAMTFVATANCIIYVGATPVFVDIESIERPLLSIADAEAKCTERTKAVILMHYAGVLCDAAAWREFASRHKLFLVEDAAHAVATDGVGRLGDAAAFSFYGNKNMTTAEGGVVLARDPKVLESVQRMRGHGLTSGTFQRLTNRSSHYDVTMLGYNYRMDELRAAIGLTQLRHVREWNSRRKSLAAHYRRIFSALDLDVIVPFDPFDVSANHIMPVVLPPRTDREFVAAFMRDCEVQTTMHYPPVHSLSFYRARYPEIELPRTEEFARREITLPLHPGMTETDVERVVRSLELALAE